MRPFRNAALLCACFVLASCARTVINETTKTVDWKMAEIPHVVQFKLPPNAEVTTQNGPDFSVTTITIGEERRPLFSIYEGNFPEDKTENLKQRITINGISGKETRSRDKSGFTSREILLTVGDQGSFYLHLFGYHLHDDDASLADDIISAIRKPQSK